MIRSTEVDGVPTLLAPADGPTTAGLVFRVGVADETLPMRGITHLVEHLALHRLGLADYHFNGSTSGTQTQFVVRGTPDQVAGYLTGVCEGLLAPPVERIQVETSILRTEAAGRSLVPLGRVRHGAQDYGLTGFPEWGLDQVRPEDVRWWIDSWFTRGNAVLWIAGSDVPPGLRLSLPDGPRRPPPVPSSALTPGPVFFTANTDLVMCDSVVEGGAPAMVYAEVLQRRLFRDLRHDGGYSYSVSTGYQARGTSAAVVSAMADARPDAYDAVVGGMVDAWAALCHAVGDEDLEAVTAQFRQALTHPAVESESLPSIAGDFLEGRRAQRPEDLLAQIEAVDAAAVREVASRSWEQGLLMVADGTDVSWTGFGGLSGHRPPVPAVIGREYPAHDDAGRRLVIGREGVSQVLGTSTATVHFERCAGLLAWPDGARQVVGEDGVSISVEPSRFGLDAVAVNTLTSAVHPSRVVWMPARDPADVPSEATWLRAPAAAAAAAAAAEPAAAPPPRAPRSRGATAGLVVLYLLAVPSTLLVLLVMLGSIGDPEVDGATWVGFCVMAVIPLGLWGWIVSLTRRTRG